MSKPDYRRDRDQAKWEYHRNKFIQNGDDYDYREMLIRVRTDGHYDVYGDIFEIRKMRKLAKQLQNESRKVVLQVIAVAAFIIAFIILVHSIHH